MVAPAAWAMVAPAARASADKNNAEVVADSIVAAAEAIAEFEAEAVAEADADAEAEAKADAEAEVEY